MKGHLLFRKLLLPLGISAVFLLIAGSVGTQPQVETTVSQEPVKYTSQLLRDPFVSLFEMDTRVIEEPTIGPGLAHLEVQGMIWNSPAPQAIINNQVVRVGEVIGNAEILEIRREGIYVLYQGKKYILRTYKIEKR